MKVLRLISILLVAFAVISTSCGSDSDSGSSGSSSSNVQGTEGCKDSAVTPIGDRSPGRDVARCEPGYPKPQPLPEKTKVSVVTKWKAEFVSPILTGIEFGEFAAENLENIEKIEGFDTDLASEIIDRAKTYLQDLEQSNQKLVEEKIKDEDLKNINGITVPMLALLAKENILTLNDFAELATFELIDKEEGILKDLDLDEEVVNKMIMKARENWFVEKT